MFRNLRIGTRLIGCFLIVALIALTIGIFGYVKIVELTNDSRSLYQYGVEAVDKIGDLSTAFHQLRVNTRDIVTATEQKELERYAEQIEKFSKEIEETFNVLAKALPDAEAKKLYDACVTAHKAYEPHLSKIVELAMAHKDAEAVAYMKGDASKAVQTEVATIDALNNHLVKAAREIADANAVVGKRAGMIMIGLAILGAIVAFILGFLISRTITVPVAAIVHQVQKVAEGDLRIQVEYRSDDEIGSLAEAFRTMVESLRTIIDQVSETSNQVSSAAAQLTATAEQIATGAEEVAAQAGTVATAGEEMSATSGDIALNCQMAAEGSREASSTATSGAEVVNATVQVMGKIATRVQETAKTVERLGASSDQIGEIIGTIQDIADQTNLLALNAAIEAARAGEQGRGFAVVADEVRALAERTTKATREIGEMIKAIQSETRSAVSAMEEGVREVESGTSEAAKSGDALKAILEQVNSVTMQINQVATAAEEQTATTSEISNNIHQITDVVQETAKGAQESASAAAQLSRTAEGLQCLVQKFKF